MLMCSGSRDSRTNDQGLDGLSEDLQVHCVSVNTALHGNYTAQPPSSPSSSPEQPGIIVTSQQLYIANFARSRAGGSP